MTTFRPSPAVTGRVAGDLPAGQRQPQPPDRRVFGIFGKHAAPPKPPSAASARWFLLAWAVLFVILAANAPGRMIFDTKLGVDIEPARFYAQLWHLWNPREWLGTLQDQYIGYAVPMAPFYLAGQVLHMPVWLTERLWMSLLGAFGFWGVVKLATALNIGRPAARMVAGAAFALWPTFTVVIGSTSAAVIPGLLAPWAVLPLVTAAQRGSVVVAAARSGAVIVCMGGVNAVSTLDALVLPALFILTRPRGRRVKLAAAWAACVAVGTCWWTVPLLLQGRYSFNFLPYVEQAATTTKTLSAAAFQRGTSNWTAYVNLGGPWVTAGWTMVSSPLAILAAAVAAAVGLAGVARKDIPEGRWLRLSVAVTALVALSAYGGSLGGPMHRSLLHLLDGPLSPFRNLYKLEPTLAAALALGIAHLTARYWRPGVPGYWWTRQTAVGVGAAAGAVFVFAGLALPYVSGQILQPGSFPQIPGYWQQAANFLAAHARDTTAVVVPGTAHGIFTWGDPIDEPLEPLARSAWVERGLVPYGGPGSQTLISTVENAIESGQQVPGLAAYLKRAGIRYVVVRNDLRPGTIGYTSPQLVHQTLSLSGFSQVAAFGPVLVTPTALQPPPQLRGLLPMYPAVEIYAAADPSQRATTPVAVLPVSQTTLVNGGPDSLLQLSGQDVLGDEPTVMSGDRLGGEPSHWVVSDGQRRADNAFGLVNNNVSYTYTATERNPVDDPLGGAGGPPRQLLPVAAAGHQTVAVLSGAAQVRASSYGSWLTATQQYDPVNAFDGNQATAWTEADPNTPVGQWIQISFDRTVSLPSSIGIALLDDSPFRAIASRVEVTTAAGRASTSLAATNSPQQLNVPAGPTGWLRLTITGADRVISGGAGAGVRDVLIPGVNVTRYLQPAEDPAGPRAPSVTFSFHQQFSSPSTFADPAAVPPMARTFTVAGAATYGVTVTARAVPSGALDDLLTRLSPPSKSALQVSATPALRSVPGQDPRNLFISGATPPWIAASATAVIHLSWHGKRNINQIAIQPAYGLSAPPESVRITSPAGTREANINPFGVVVFVPGLVTDRIDISFPAVQPIKAINPLSGQPTPLPVGVQKLNIPALAGLHVVAPPAGEHVSLRCGQGPAVTVDGRSYQTSVTGTTGAMTQFLPVQVRLCSKNGALQLSAGRHWLAAAAPGVFAVTDVTLSTGTQPASSSASGASPPTTSPAFTVPAGGNGGGQTRVLDVFTWQAENRQLGIGPGPAAYLEIHENANPGWVAKLNGQRLTPVRLDGWQQGFIVPAGEGGIVTLTFTPSLWYHLALALAVLGVITMLVIATRAHTAPGQRPGGRPQQPSLRGPAAERSATNGRAADEPPPYGWFTRPVALSGPATGPHAPSPDGTGWLARRAGMARRAGAWLAVAGVCGLVYLTGGPLAFAVGGLAVLAFLRPRWLPAVAFTAMVTAGLFAATAIRPTELGSGAFGGPAQACALIALAAALMPALAPASSTGQDGSGGRSVRLTPQELLGRPQPTAAWRPGK